MSSSAKLGSGATTEGARTGADAAGAAVYDLGFLVSQVPHGVITVSLATAIIPMLSGLAADRDFGRFRLELGRTLRIALVIVVPLAVALACLGQQVATIANLTGNLNGGTESIGWTIQAFAIAMVAFTVHYLMLRGFYANEDTRTPFFIQIVIAAVNITAAIALTSMVEPARVAMMLALAYGIAYVVGSILSTTLLSRTVGSLIDREMLAFVGKLVAGCGSRGVGHARDRRRARVGRPGPDVSVGWAAHGVRRRCGWRGRLCRSPRRCFGWISSPTSSKPCDAVPD